VFTILLLLRGHLTAVHQAHGTLQQAVVAFDCNGGFIWWDFSCHFFGIRKSSYLHYVRFEVLTAVTVKSLLG
jgi:hypothetical protein